MDALIVGCGLAGSVVARHLAEKLNRKVVIWERRNHIGGNLYDYTDEHGILVHQYGPHIFHTNNDDVYKYIMRFAKWNNFNLTYYAQIDGKFTPTPFNFQTIDDFYSKEQAVELKERIGRVFGERKSATVVEVLNCDDPVIREYGRFLFEKDYSLYTAKQWGISASEVDPSILKRVPLYFSYDTGYFTDKYQLMPENGYTEMFKNLLDHPNIQVELEVDALKHIRIIENKIFIDDVLTDKPVIYTGALDELFGQCDGKLPYRSLKFEWRYEDLDSKQDAPVVAYPQAEDFTRITEYKKLPVQKVKGTTYAIEYPLQYDETKQMEPYYPVLTEQSQNTYKKYNAMAHNVKDFYFLGRLADFKYYNMDQVIERALNFCDGAFGVK